MTRNLIKWGKRQAIEGSSRHSAYYDHTSYKVPFTGSYDQSRIWSAINRLFPPQFNKFGGYTTLGDVEQLDESHIKVTLLYHIGD